MNTTVETYVEVIGYHCWVNAPEEVAFLRSYHRHRFCIRSWFPVQDADREIEIFMQERLIEEALRVRFGGGHGELLFGGRSCEHIAIELLNAFPEMSACQVLEDGKGGALVRK